MRFDSGPLTTTLCHAVLPKDVYTLYCHIGAIFAYFGIRHINDEVRLKAFKGFILGQNLDRI